MFEIFNEITILMMFYHLQCYTDGLVPNPELRYKIGFSQLFFFAVFLAVHVFILLKSMKKDIMEYITERQNQRIIKRIQSQLKQKDGNKAKTDLEKEPDVPKEMDESPKPDDIDLDKLAAELDQYREEEEEKDR